MSDIAENGTQTVVILQAVHAPGGFGSWGPGERAGFEPEIARDLVTRGVARFLTESEVKASAEIRVQQDREEYQQRIEQGLQIPPRLAHLAAERAGA